MKTVIGKVIPGAGQSRLFGYPTANLELRLKPDIEPGVYVATTRFNNSDHQAVVCFGAGNSDRFEVHVLDYDGDLVDQEIEVELKDRISGLIETDNQEMLKEKIEADIKLAREHFA